jgi:hypothetical protein
MGSHKEHCYNWCLTEASLDQASILASAGLWMAPTEDMQDMRDGASAALGVMVLFGVE